MNTLLIKSIAGMLNFFIVMALCLFLPAMTFQFWQAWLYLFCVLISVLYITIYLLRQDSALLQRRLRVGMFSEPRLYQRIIQTFSSLLFIFTYLISGFDHRFHWSSVPPFLVIPADVVVLVGFYVVYRVFMANSYTSSVIEISEEQLVITTGPYAHVRHPLYSGALLMMLATPIALGSWWGLIAIPPLILVVILRLLDEEGFLRESLPGYEEYCRIISWRLIPRVW